MEREEDDLEDIDVEELMYLTSSQSGDFAAEDWSRILQTSGAEEDSLLSLEEGSIESILHPFVDGNNNNNNNNNNNYTNSNYANNDNLASIQLTPEPANNASTEIHPNCEPAYPDVQGGSPSPEVEKTFIITVPFGISPVFASAGIGAMLQTPNSCNRPRCASTSVIPDTTTKKQPRKRPVSEAEKKERRKESNRRAAEKYRRRQRATAEEIQEDYHRVLDENETLRLAKESLEAQLETIRNAWKCHCLVCPMTD